MSDLTPHAEEQTPRETRERILACALDLLNGGGREALTTRAVATAAGVQAPTLYRLFGDKDGLLDAVAEYGLAAYVAAKTAIAPDPDPLERFRQGWDGHVAFGLANPTLFAIAFADPGRISPAGDAGVKVLGQKISDLAQAGLLRVPEERALGLTKAACNGAILTLLSKPVAERDPGLADAAREATIAAMTGSAPAAPPGPVAASITLKASLDHVGALTPGERHLLSELLDRIAKA